MKRIARAATLTVASCALVMGGAGAATAYDGSWKDNGKHNGHKGHDRRGHDFRDDDDEFNHVGNSASAEATTIGSGGFLSGNIVQVPINIPINVCGNSWGGGSLLNAFNPAIGNTCINGASIDDHDDHHDDHRDDDHDNRRNHY
ncbi:chaplin [Streptomyces sp. 7N604]|uniref:chaplin n=1 Tax=Streptomyces sp. 7N604 TaxID=3457415 RepID=UPI003FD0AF9B